MKQAIGYIRRSTDKQDESLDQQRSTLEAFARSKGWQLVHVYVDDAISGSEMKRPGLSELLQRVTEDSSIDAVLAWDRNRLARPKDPLDGLLLERRLLEAGKRVVYAATGKEADRSFAGGLLGYVEHYQNGDYLRKLSRDTVRGIVARVERGQWPGGPIPFGYDRLILDTTGQPRKIIRDSDDGSQVVLDVDTRQPVEAIPRGKRYAKQDHEVCTLIPSDPARVRAIQKMFHDFAQGVPSRKLRDDLNASGYRTSRGSRFTVQTILPILENPAYLGRCVYNRRTLSKWHRLEKGVSVERLDEGVEHRPESDWIVKEDAWPAIIDRETFERVQERRKLSRQRDRQMRGSCIAANYLLPHVMTCGVCGGKMIGQTITSGKGYRTRYYVCQNHHKGFYDVCPKRQSMPADRLEQHIVQLIRQDLAALRHDDQLHEQVAQAVKALQGQQDDSGSLLEQRLSELDRELAALRGHLKAMDPATAQSLGLYDDARRLTDERSIVSTQLAKARRATPRLPGVEEIRVRAKAALERFEQVMEAGTLEEKREQIGLYVQMIKADASQRVAHISLYPAIFTSQIAGVDFDKGITIPQTLLVCRIS